MNRLLLKTLGLCLLVGGLMPTPQAIADWQCACGAIVHVNYPTTCPLCNRELPNRVTPPPFTPPFTPPGMRPPRPPWPWPGQRPGAVDSSGLTLGVNVYQVGSRVIVQSTLPNTPAEGRLFPNDQLVMGAFRDAATGELQRIQIRHPDDLTELKTLAGAGTQVALRVYRPTTGVRDFFVSFKAPGVVTRTYERSGRSAPGAEPEAEPEGVMGSRSATFTEDTTGEAAAMLGSGGGADAGAAPVMRQPGQPGVQPGQPGRPSLQPGRPSLQPGRPAPRPAQPGVQPGQPSGESASDLLGQ
jgi:hypothetical protein